MERRKRGIIFIPRSQEIISGERKEAELDLSILGITGVKNV